MAEAAKKKKIFDGRYEVLSIVGRGAASVVYHARHVGALTSEVALKVLVKQAAPDGKSNNSDLLRKEALAMVSARHKYVVRLDDFHSVGELCYLAMEYAPLGDARKYISNSGGKLDIGSGEIFLLQTAEALDFVHRVGIVHRDIKPDNILVINEGEIRLADFGVAVLPGESASMKDLQAGVGTMSYMAPEVIEGVAYDKRSDIYSLGVSFYELFSGIHPFEKAPLIKQLEVREDKNLPPLHVVAPEVPMHISNVIMQALSYDPARRFTSCQELIQSLQVSRGSAAAPRPAPRKAAPAPTAAVAAEQPPVASAAPRRPANQRVPLEASPGKTVQPPPAEPAVARAPVPPVRPQPAAAPEPVTPAPQPAAVRPAAPPPVQPKVERFDSPESYEPPPVQKAAAPAESESEPAPAARPVQPPPRSQPSKLAPSSYPTQDGKKPKRSLEDLRKLARETKSSPAATAESPKAAEPRRPLRPVASISAGSRSLSSFFMIVVGVALLYIVYGYFFGSPSSDHIPDSPIQISEPSPSAVAKTLSFPDLASGIYHGKTRGILSGGELPLSLISLGAERGVIVVIGIEGWTPQLVVPQAGTSSLRVASNGMIIELNGNAGESDVSGEINNIVTGEKGTWSVERSR